MIDRGSRTLGRIDPSLAAVIVVGLAVASSWTVFLFLGVRGTGGFWLVRGALHLAYVVALLWYLTDSGRPTRHTPAVPLGHAADGRVGRWVAAAAAAALCVMGLLDLGLFLLLLAAATLGLLAIWRRQITTHAVFLGFTASVFAFLTGGIAFWRHGFVAKPMLIFMLVAIPPMFVAGGLLVGRTGLGSVRVLERRYRMASRSFLAGVLLFVPLGLSNLAGSIGSGMAWVDEWWQPLVLPLWSGIVEEVVFRALLVSLLFALLQPLFARTPAIAIGLAVFFSATTFGLGHGQTLGNFFGAGLGFGLPLAFIFVRRDWEHAVGAHYAINLVPWLMALIAT